MKVANFYYPTKISIGSGLVSKIFTETDFTIKHCFVVSGKSSMRDAGVLDEINSLAIKNNISITFSNSVNTNPTDKEIDELCLACKQSKADTVIGIGGGSSMDVAKIISMIVNNGGKSWDYVNTNERTARKIKNARLKLILIPTTSGTASESTPYAVLTNAETKMKKGIGDDYLYADNAFIDSDILALMPKNIISITGFDAFGQALEGYTSKNSNMISEYYGYSSAKLIIENLRQSWLDNNNVTAKLNMAWGTIFSGLSIGLVDVNLAHAMSHPISAYYGIQHGLAVLLCTFQSIRFNQERLQNKYSKVANLMGYKNGGADEIIYELESWIKLFDIDIKLKNYGVKINDLQKFADDALMVGAINTNIRKVKKEDLISLYNKIYEGILD